MLALLIANLIIYGANSLFFYTRLTFALVTFYFGVASTHSIYGCYKYWNEVGDDNINNAILDQEQSMPINPPNHGLSHGKIAGVWCYFFQIIFQVAIFLHLHMLPFVVAENQDVNRMSVPIVAACMSLSPLLLRPLLLGEVEFENEFNMGGDGYA